MTEKYAVVITTINSPTRAVIEIARDCPRLDAQFVIIGDGKSPPDFVQEGSDYFDLAAQVATGFEYAKIAPSKHYARKNVGYLVAARGGATVIIETDDDNIPFDEFWAPRTRAVEAKRLEKTGWTNLYGYFSQARIWPRGLPLQNINDPLPNLPSTVEVADCPIQQGLANQNPDVDAVYRLILPLPVDFDRRDEGVAAGAGAWCPFNSQNTTWWRDAFPLLYLPYYCSFRMTDIWRSFVAQRIAWENGWSVLFHNATVFQERNEHSLIRDFEEEIPGYLNNDKIAVALDALKLEPGVENIPANLRTCYAALVEAGWVGEGELALVDAWLTDIAN